jgi:hypothetical protein
MGGGQFPATVLHYWSHVLTNVGPMTDGNEELH